MLFAIWAFRWKLLTSERFSFAFVCGVTGFCSRINYTRNKVNWADVIVPIGGDGTFLLAASKVMDNTKPVIGFNSDPTRSEGFLCLPKRYSENVDEAVKRLKTVSNRNILFFYVGRRASSVKLSNIT